MAYKYYWITILDEVLNKPVFKKVRGIHVVVGGFECYEFFVNKDPKEDNLYNFSEALTGWGVVLRKNSEQEAIETIKITGITPYYKIETKSISKEGK
jgi:hypothetical protein